MWKVGVQIGRAWMAVAERTPEPLVGRPGHRHPRTRPTGCFGRPVAVTGWKWWLFTIDHKKIRIMYGAGALFCFVAGGIEALLIRLQLAQPDGKERTGRGDGNGCARPDPADGKAEVAVTGHVVEALQPAGHP